MNRSFGTVLQFGLVNVALEYTAIISFKQRADYLLTCGLLRQENSLVDSRLGLMPKDLRWHGRVNDTRFY